MFLISFADEVMKLESSTYALKMTGAILGPVAMLIVAVVIVWYFMRRKHHKRLMASRSKHDPETYYASDEILRATSAGDSTLRVRFLSTFFSMTYVCKSIWVRPKTTQVGKLF